MASPIQFGRYQLMDQLAMGGMAEIFLARLTGEAGFGKPCVIKRVLPHLASSSEFVGMFLDEARIAAQLNHPGIVQVFDFGRVGEHYFLAMELLVGEDAASLLELAHRAGAPFPPAIAVSLIASAAEALEHAHHARDANGVPLQIVHRDISPSNLFVTYSGKVKVLDFGIARAQSRLHQTRTGQVRGKLAYMAPEQADGAGVDARADVWSLGVCLYEFLTGVRLFKRETLSETALSLLQGEIPPPSRLRPELPRELDEIVLRALQRDLGSRHPSAGALQRDLESWLGHGTYVGSTQIVAYLDYVCGEERIRARTLRLSPPADTVGPATREVTGGARSEEAKTQIAHEPVTMTEPAGEAPRRRLRPWAWAALPVSLLAVASLYVAVANSADAPVAGVPEPKDAVQARPARATDAVVTNAQVTTAAALVPGGAPTAATVPATNPEPGAAVDDSTRAGGFEDRVPARAAARTTPARSSTRATPRRAEPARLSVRSNLPAVAWVDGVRVGTLPLQNVPLSPGGRTLRIVAEGEGASRTMRLRLTAGGRHDASVQFQKGTLNIQATPWATVYINGVNVGETPLGAISLWEGRHVVRLVGPNREKTVEVQVRGGKTAIVAEDFE